jgi:hypothetical protein
MYLVNINGQGMCVAGHYPLAPELAGNVISCPACNVGLPQAMRALANFMVWVELEAMYQSPERRYKLRGDPLVWSLRSGKLRLEYP